MELRKLLGFSEKQDDLWLLSNRFFPSKIGGRTAWLELENIPDSKDISCDYCNQPCTFLCQVYAGQEKVSHAFHRTIFVFICKNGKCCNINQSGNIKVLRSQLPLKNKFFPDVPADESIEISGIEPICKTCNVCVCKASKVCGKCKNVSYCGQYHQQMDWKSHKKVCGQDNLSKTNQIESYLFPEYEIVIEVEDDETNTNKKKLESDKEAATRRLREYEDMIKGGKIVHNSDITEDDLKEFDESKEDKAFGNFKKAIERYPSQVIRYNRGLEPLWISSIGILKKSNIPNCSNCNGKRSFEFQIMPQMLNDLKNYDLDWGIVAIYTCEKDCNTNEKYIHEFCYKQDVTKVDSTNSIDIDLKNKLEISEDNSKDETRSLKACTEDPCEIKKTFKNNKEYSKKAFKESDNWE